MSRIEEVLTGKMRRSGRTDCHRPEGVATNSAGQVDQRRAESAEGSVSNPGNVVPLHIQRGVRLNGWKPQDGRNRQA